MSNLSFGFVVNSVVRLVFTRRIVNIFGYLTMDDKSVKLESLLKNLEDAEKKAKNLSNDVFYIRSEIAKLIREVTIENTILPRKKPRKSILLDCVPSSSNFGEAPSRKSKTTEIADKAFDIHGFRIVEDYVMVYTSGACDHPGSDEAKAGVGVYFGENHHMNISKPVEEATRNVADMQACLVALMFLKDIGVKRVMLHTSSELTINYMTSEIKSLKANNWKTVSGKYVENKEDLVRLDACAAEFDDIKWIHFEDQHAGELANRGASRHKKSKTSSLGKVTDCRNFEGELSDTSIEVSDEAGPENSGLKSVSSINRVPDSHSWKDKPSSRSKRKADEIDYGDAGFQKSGDYVVVYTDGACPKNGKLGAKAGIGVWFGDNHPMNISRPVVGKATNIVAEIQACTAALRVLQRNGIKKVKLYTDSKFTIDSMTVWMQRWKTNDWKTVNNKPVKNKEEFMKLDESASNFVDLQWILVPGHSGVHGNEEADKLARLGAARYQSN